ncbi:MAG: c-type cytochrome [Roseiarcus sp.]
MIGHFGYPTPVSVWRPDPEVYADMSWPPSSNAPADATPAQRLYIANCAICHGPDGRGNGSSAPSMIPRPRDFTQGLYKYKSTPNGAPPSDDDLVAVVSNGLHASGMPYFRGVLSESQIRDVVGYVKGFSKVFAASAAAAAIAPTERPSAGPDSVSRGARLYLASGCITCHGEDLRGGQWLQDAKGYPVVSRDLTASWTFRGGDAPEQVYLRLSTGLAPSPMPSFATLSSDDRWDLVNFLESRRRTPPWLPGGALAGPGEARDLESRGRYLVHTEMCGLCHTEIDPALVYRDDHYLAGGMRVGAYPQGVFIARNLTSDPDAGLGRWSEAEVAVAIRDGRAKDGRVLNFWGMPRPWLHNLTPEDALAIARHLKTLPAIHNNIPPPLHYGVAETIAAKFWYRSPVLGQAPRLTYAIGNYANGETPSAGAVADALGAAQGLAFVVGLILFARLPRRAGTRGGWLRTAGFVVTGVAVLGIGYFLYATPAVSVLPPDQVANGASGSIPRPDVSQLPTEQAALMQRGRYIFANASCAYCHNNDGSGGLKLSGPFGTMHAANLTSDRDYGLGAWSDAEIARAVRSGVSRDGRPLYWQGMPWDHFSNLDEEDVVALIAFLRVLPPVATKTPPYRPPTTGDCSVYTFWTVPDAELGCR